MLLEIKNLKASYGLVPAIHEANFHAKEGEVVGILGHNGMGKTTLLRTIMGFVKQNFGEISFQVVGSIYPNKDLITRSKECGTFIFPIARQDLNQKI